MPKEYYNGEPLGGTYASAAQVIFNDLIAQYGASSVQEALEALISRKIETSDIVNVQTNDADKVPSAALAYAMSQTIGFADISAIGDGTLSGGVSSINSRLNKIQYRAGTIQVSLTKTMSVEAAVTFSTPMPESDYFAIVLPSGDNYHYAAHCSIQTKSKEGFSFRLMREYDVFASETTRAYQYFAVYIPG